VETTRLGSAAWADPTPGDTTLELLAKNGIPGAISD